MHPTARDGPKSEAQNSIQISNMAGRDKPIELSVLSPTICISRKLETGVRVGVSNPGTAMWDAGFRNSILRARLKVSL